MTEPGPETDALSGVLAEIAEAAGPAAALQLARDLGGSSIYVARAPKAGSLLVDAVGLEAARAIARIYGGENIQVPLGPMAGGPLRRAEIRRRLNQGVSAQRIARDLGVLRQTVQKIKKVMMDERQPDLFAGSSGGV